MNLDTAVTIIFACLVSFVSLLILIIFFGLKVPRSLPFLHAAFACLAIGGIRFFIRAIGQNINHPNQKKVAIYGAGSAGRQLLEALKWDTQYRVCSIIDDNHDLVGKSIGGIKVETFEQAVKNFRSNNIKALLLADSNKNIISQTKVLNLLKDQRVSIKSIPNMRSLISDKQNIGELPDIEIEDLLGRDPTQPIKKLMTKSITGKAVLITGAGGSIGSELYRQIVLLKPACLIVLDISEFAIYRLLEEQKTIDEQLPIIPLIGSVGNRLFVRKTLKQFSVDTVFHAAAFKHVPLMEQNIMQCINNNVFGTKTLAEEAVDSGVGNFILISTDKAVHPTNFMGASKRFSELICQDLANMQNDTHFSIVRFGNVLGSSGSVVPLFRQQIVEGGPVTVTEEEVTRYFMTVSEAAELVIQATSLSKSGEILVLDMGEPVKILDLAKKMITLSGKIPLVGDLPKEAPQGSINIRITGLRSGEKIKEELSYDENLQKTEHPRIFLTGEGYARLPDLEHLLAEIKHAIKTNNHEKLIEQIKHVCIGVVDVRSSIDNFLTSDTSK